MVAATEPVRALPLKLKRFDKKMKSTHRFYELEDVQILEVYNLLYEMENKQILAAAISRIEKGFTNFVVDFKDTNYINSVGLSFLINLMIKLSSNKC